MKEFFDPRVKGGLRWWHLHSTAVLIVAAVIIAYLLGVGTAHYGASYFRSHYQASQSVPRATATIATPHLSVPATGSIRISYYPAVGDQGPIGACAAWASTFAVSYQWRMTHRSWLRFSPRQAYDHYSDVYNGGQDGGSWPNQDLEISNTVGLLKFNALPEPPYVIDNPEPTVDAYGRPVTQDAIRFPLTFHMLGGYQEGQGQGLVDLIKGQVAAGYPVLIGFPVWPEYDAATNGLITSPTPAEVSQEPQGRGGHENVILAYDDGKIFPDGTVGGFYIQNQWTTRWGVGGRAWISYDFAAKYVFGAEYTTLGVSHAR